MFEAQKEFKTNDSWVKQVENDIQTCGINLKEEEIKKLSQYKIKKLVAKKMRIKTDEYLLKLKKSHTKTEHLYPSDEMKEYLKTDQLTRSEKLLLFKLRTRMVDLKGNFSESYRSNLHCELCDDESEDETQMHLLQCNILNLVQNCQKSSMMIFKVNWPLK